MPPISYTPPPSSAYEAWSLDDWNRWLDRQPADVKQAFAAQPEKLVYVQELRVEFNPDFDTRF